ncbi:TNT domain-containing protein [Micromonospora sp. NPDC005299]|uniref:TNT domain-containing protein n=1 Tax=Micromonospora sp. NPDC005299 TaxID=3364231 RepID=UPI0036C4482D
MLPGYRLDRFGFPGGTLLAPLGTPFSSRSLTPQNLNTPEDAPLANYHVYCVRTPFTVDSGPVAPWFAQPGMGTQIRLNPAYLPQAGAVLSVRWLLDNGYLVEEDLGSDPITCATAADVGIC